MSTKEGPSFPVGFSREVPLEPVTPEFPTSTVKTREDYPVHVPPTLLRCDRSEGDSTQKSNLNDMGLGGRPKGAGEGFEETDCVLGPLLDSPYFTSLRSSH